MAKQQTCDISVILDRSGSMGSIKDATISAFNKFVDDQKKVPGACKLSLYQFDEHYETVYAGVAIDNVPPLTSETFIPRGFTALLDAIGRTIDQTGARLAGLPESQRPFQVIVVILTDGVENASKEYTREKIVTMITHQRDKYSWEFVFLGANQDAIVTATSYGMLRGNALTFDATSIGTQTASGTASAGITSYRLSGEQKTSGGILSK